MAGCPCCPPVAPGEAAPTKATKRSDDAETRKLVGLIGGLAPPSTIEYYRKMNELFSACMGRPGQEAMPCVMYSADCHKVVEWEKAGDWVQIGLHLSAAAKRLEAAGCSCARRDAAGSGSAHVEQVTVRAVRCVPRGPSPWERSGPVGRMRFCRSRAARWPTTAR